MDAKRILVVDDEDSLCEILKFNLEREGYDVVTASSAEEALTLDIQQFDLLILDVMMGELSGFGLARILKRRPQTASVPIIFCTAKDSEESTVEGLDIGADDYVSKPFSVGEMMARVRSVLRRAASERNPDEMLQYEGLEINLTNKTCYVDGNPVSLTRKELEILILLLSHRGAIMSREQILRSVWGSDVIVLDRTIDVNITRMRHKIGRYGTNIVTRIGFGYGFEG